MKDIKYIIKRVLIGVLIASILMAIKQVNAEELGNVSAINIHNYWGSNVIKATGNGQTLGQTDYFETILPTSPPLVNSGKGFFIFSFAYYSEPNTPTQTFKYNAIIDSVSIKSGNSLYACEIGNLEPYTDSSVQYRQATAKCYVNFSSSGFERIRFQVPYLPAHHNITIYLSRYGTFVGSATSNITIDQQQVVNAITNSSAEQIRLQTQTNAKLDTQIRQNDTIISQNEEQIKQQKETNDLLKDDSPADDNEVMQALDTGNLPGGGAISSIVSLPITLINVLLSALGSSCTDLTVPLPFVNQSVTIPCVASLFTDMKWSVYYEFVGGIAGAVILFKYLLYLYDRLSDLLYLEDKGLIGKVA